MTHTDDHDAPEFHVLPKLTLEQARLKLSIHAFRANLEERRPDMQVGFLGSLRPFSGLREAAFFELMACVKVLGVTWSQSDVMHRQDISSLFGICQLARVWGLEPAGMLQSNNLISDDQIATLAIWLDCLSYAIMTFLDSDNVAEALSPFKELMRTSK